MLYSHLAEHIKAGNERFMAGRCLDFTAKDNLAWQGFTEKQLLFLADNELKWMGQIDYRVLYSILNATDKQDICGLGKTVPPSVFERLIW